MAENGFAGGSWDGRMARWKIYEAWELAGSFGEVERCLV